jgi:hypothetical protein
MFMYCSHGGRVVSFRQQERFQMFEIERLPFTIDLWAEDGLSVVEELARVSSLSLARVAFDAAAVIFPRRKVTLHGPGVCEVHGFKLLVDRPPPRLGRHGAAGETPRAGKAVPHVA